eukprot:624435_1
MAAYVWSWTFFFLNGEKKLSGSVIVPDKWKDGSKNTAPSSSVSSNKARKVGQNMLLKSTKPTISKKKKPKTMIVRKCKICKQLTQPGGHYCQDCAYKKGICSMCGRKVIDTKFYKQSSV